MSKLRVNVRSLIGDRIGRAGVDEVHLAVAPVLLGRGEPLLFGLDLPALGYQVAEQARSEAATHVVIRRLRRE